MSYLIGIDIGTSGCKTVAFDLEGRVAASASAEYPLSQPNNGWAEQNPLDWWQAVESTLETVLEKVGLEEVKGIGLSGQMHGLVMLDEQGDVLRPAIIWCDQRTADQCRTITEKVGSERLINITANPALTGFTASKILWVRENQPDIYQKCRHILLPKDYIRFKLTGRFATDVSDAGGMQLLDIRERKWSLEVLEKLDIDPSLLAEVYESVEVTGHYHGIPVVAGAGDNAAAAVGTGVVEEGRAFTTIGTSGVVYAHTKSMHVDLQGRVHTFCAAVPGEWHVMGVTQGAGLSLQWFKKQFAQNLSYKELDELALNTPIGSRGLVYLPYLMGERTPHLDPDCRGVFFGLSAMHTQAELARAVMEGVGFSMLDCANVLKSMDVHMSDMAVCGGGARSPIWRQMLADLYDCPIATIEAAEGPCLGAAILAGVGAGMYSSVQAACSKLIRKSAVYQPISENSSAYGKYYEVYCSLYTQLKDLFPKIKQ